jgi:hypothetical protein
MNIIQEYEEQEKLRKIQEYTALVKYVTGWDEGLAKQQAIAFYKKNNK